MMIENILRAYTAHGVTRIRDILQTRDGLLVRLFVPGLDEPLKYLVSDERCFAARHGGKEVFARILDDLDRTIDRALADQAAVDARNFKQPEWSPYP